MGLIVHLLPTKKISDQQEATLQSFVNALKKESSECHLKIFEVTPFSDRG